MDQSKYSIQSFSYLEKKQKKGREKSEKEGERMRELVRTIEVL